MDKILRGAINDMKAALRKNTKEQIIAYINKGGIEPDDAVTTASLTLIKTLNFAELHLAMEPRIIEYEFIDSLDAEFDADSIINLFESASFSRPWIMNIANDGDIITCLHFLDDNSGDVFVFYKLVEEKHFGIVLVAALSREEYQVRVTDESMVQHADYIFMVLSLWQLMTKEKDNYVEIKSNNTKKKKGHKFLSANEPLIQYITLTDVGKHYINSRKGKGTNDFTKGKIQLDTHVGGFLRKYWIGHGADKHLEQLHVNGHNRRQWVLPVNKVVKIKKADIVGKEDTK